MPQPPCSSCKTFLKREKVGSFAVSLAVKRKLFHRGLGSPISQALAVVSSACSASLFGAKGWPEPGFLNFEMAAIVLL